MDSRITKTTYRQLTFRHRYQIQSDLAAGFSVSEVAQHIGCHRRTVYRKLRRYPGHGYGARKAHRAGLSRRCSAYKHSKFTLELWHLIARQIRRRPSPEMIAGRMALEGRVERLSASTRYSWLRWDD